jgi:hypothetical protein
MIKKMDDWSAVHVAITSWSKVWLTPLLYANGAVDNGNLHPILSRAIVNYVLPTYYGISLIHHSAHSSFR